MEGPETEHKHVHQESMASQGSIHFNQQGHNQVTLIYGSHVDPKEVVKSRRLSPGPGDYNVPP